MEIYIGQVVNLNILRSHTLLGYNNISKIHWPPPSPTYETIIYFIPIFGTNLHDPKNQEIKYTAYKWHNGEKRFSEPINSIQST